MDRRNYRNNNDNHPEVARLPYRYLTIISNNTGSRINPRAYVPENNRGYYKINAYAGFQCPNCGNSWTSNKVTVELWMKNKKWEFDVRMYGQSCKKCNGDYAVPFLYGISDIIDRCIYVLLNPGEGGSGDVNKNMNKSNSSHDESRCQIYHMTGKNC